MFGLSKKNPQPIKENNETPETDHSAIETHVSNNLSSGSFSSEHRDSFLSNNSGGNELNILKADVPDWEKTFDWADDVSWSKVLISESENLRHTGTINRQKDSAMVILVRRLEHFPTVKTIQAVRQNIQKDITRLNSVREAMQPIAGQKPDRNPILTQTNVELSSELNKIIIEQEAFEKKIQSELEIINTLIESIVNSGKPRTLIYALLEIYQFGITRDGVYHLSTPLPVPELEPETEFERTLDEEIKDQTTPESITAQTEQEIEHLQKNIKEIQEEIQKKSPKSKGSKTGDSIKQMSDVINQDPRKANNHAQGEDSSYFDYNFIFGPDRKPKN